MNKIKAFYKKYRNWIIWAVIWAVFGAFILNPVLGSGI